MIMSFVICRSVWNGAREAKLHIQKVNLALPELDELSKRMSQISYDFDHDDSLPAIGGEAAAPVIMALEDAAEPVVVEKDDDEPFEVSCSVCCLLRWGPQRTHVFCMLACLLRILT
jgi:hypothetical protein